MRHLPLRLLWTPLDIAPLDSAKSTARLARILRSWDGTQYACGQGVRGVSTDCVRSVVLILSEWMRHTPPDINTLPPDAAMHSRETSIAGLKTILRSLPPNSPVEGCTVMPGDVLIVGPKAGGPGHAIIVGTIPNSLWQATTAGFCRGGWSLPDVGSRVFAIRRFDSLESTV